MKLILIISLFYVLWSVPSVDGEVLGMSLYFYTDMGTGQLEAVCRVNNKRKAIV